MNSYAASLKTSDYGSRDSVSESFAFRVIQGCFLFVVLEGEALSVLGLLGVGICC